MSRIHAYYALKQEHRAQHAESKYAYYIAKQKVEEQKMRAEEAPKTDKIKSGQRTMFFFLAYTAFMLCNKDFFHQPRSKDQTFETLKLIAESIFLAAGIYFASNKITKHENELQQKIESSPVFQYMQTLNKLVQHNRPTESSTDPKESPDV